MIDVHTHFDMESNKPIDKYIETLKEAKIKNVVLILNSSNEMDLFWKNRDRLISELEMIHIVLLCDIHNPDFFYNNAQISEKLKIPYSIKLHPRLSKIERKDFCSITNYIKDFSFRNIVIDSFLYGSNLESWCYIELAIFMARNFPTHNIVMAHFGGIETLKTMLSTRELKNITYDCSLSVDYLKGTSIWMDLKHCILHSKKRVMFGSDMPSFSPQASVKNLREMLGNQEIGLWDNLFEKNAREIYFKDGV